MGIKGLETFIEREYPDVLETVNIKLCAQEYAQRKKRDPILLINGVQLCLRLCQKIPLTVSHLCLIDKIGLHVERLINLYTDCNIKCIVYFKAYPYNDFTRYVKARMSEAEKIPSIVNNLESERPADECKEYIRDLTTDMELVKYFLRFTECEFKQFHITDDIAAVQFCSQYECFGLLEQDTDFIIMGGIENYFAIKYLDESGLQTKAYRRDIFANCLGIDESFLPILASLCTRNHYDIEQDLREFHLYLLRDFPGRFEKYIPHKLLLPKIGQWINYYSYKFKNSGNTPRAIAELIQCPQLESKISDRFNFYSLNRDHPPLPIYPERYFDEEYWSKVMRQASIRFEEKYFHQAVWSVLSCKKHFIKHNVLSLCEVPYPHCIDIVKDLLCRIYGVLLRECPGDSQTAVVQLYSYNKDLGYSPSVLNPTFPTDHPGLLYLWGDCPISEKLSLLCWIISDKLNPSFIFCIPEEVRIASLALFYLVNEGKCKWEPWQVEALVGQLVCLSEGVVLPNYMRRPLKSLQIHISSVYMATWSFTAMADEACGNPLQVNRAPIIFDGVIFNKLLHIMKFRSVIAGVTDCPLFKTILDFVRMSKP